MDLRNGEIKDLDEMKKLINDLDHFVEIAQEDMTEKQKETKQVSLHDTNSVLGKKLHRERKTRGYSQMTKNQRRNLRNKLKRS